MSSPTIISSSNLTPIDRIDQLYRTIVAGHATGLTYSYDWRAHQLKQLFYLLQENESALEQALATDLGRPKLESHALELSVVKVEILDTLKNLKSWIKPRTVKTALAWFLAKPRISHEPKGIVLIFGAWK